MMPHAAAPVPAKFRSWSVRSNPHDTPTLQSLTHPPTLLHFCSLPPCTLVGPVRPQCSGRPGCTRVMGIQSLDHAVVLVGTFPSTAGWTTSHPNRTSHRTARSASFIPTARCFGSSSRRLALTCNRHALCFSLVIHSLTSAHLALPLVACPSTSFVDTGFTGRTFITQVSMFSCWLSVGLRSGFPIT